MTRVAITLVTLAALVSGGCASTQYTPHITARGELTLRYDGGYEMWAGGRRVSRGLAWYGLERHVRCVPRARELAARARTAGGAATAFSVLAGTFGVGALGGFYGLADAEHRLEWLGGGVAVAATGLVFGIIAQAMKNRANGSAVDALNYYNDAVGSLGATCEDLVYPPPVSDLPPLSPDELPPPTPSPYAPPPPPP